MAYNVISLTGSELSTLTKEQMNLLIQAQNKKDELARKMQKQLEIFTEQAYSNGLKNSSLIDSKKQYLNAEFKKACIVLADDLLIAMSLENPPPTAPTDVGYEVNYSLPPITRYRAVKEFYLSKPLQERLELFKNDAVAAPYLGTYYSLLQDILTTSP